MIGFHRIASIEARVSTLPDSNWVELKLTAVGGQTTVVDFYFSSRNSGFEEEHRFAAAFADAINSVPPIIEPEPIEYPVDHPVEGDLGSIPL